MTATPSPLGPPSALAAFEMLVDETLYSAAGRTFEAVKAELLAAFTAQVERADKAEAVSAAMRANWETFKAGEWPTQSAPQ